MNKLVKSIMTHRYYIELRQIEDTYVIMLEDTSEPVYSSPIYDCSLALFMFDVWVQQLEGF